MRKAAIKQKPPRLGKKDIQIMLEARILEVCARYLDGGRAGSVYWEGACSPVRADRHPGSFFVRIRGGGIGLWTDHVDRSTYKGNVIQLIAASLNYADLKSTAALDAAYAEARKFLNVDAVDPADVARIKAEAARKRAQADAVFKENAQKQRDKAFSLWLSCQKTVLDTPAETFLKQRGIDLRLFAQQPGAMRFHPQLDYHSLAVWEKKDGRNIKVKAAPQFPAIVCYLSRPDHTCGGVHRTYLSADGLTKADLPEGYAARLVLGQQKGNCIRVWNGAGNIPLKEANEKKIKTDLVIVEGLEDALTVVLAAPEMRVWAALNVGNIGEMPVEMPAIGRVFVWADNDDDNPTATKAFQAAFAKLLTRNPRCEVVRSPIGKDANDLLLGKR